MGVNFRCECGRDYSVSAERAGATIACPACGNPLMVPAMPYGERRKKDNGEAERRQAADPGEAAGKQRDDERRRQDRRAPGGEDISHLPEVMPRDPSASAVPRPPGPPRPSAAVQAPAMGMWWLAPVVVILGLLLLWFFIF